MAALIRKRRFPRRRFRRPVGVLIDGNFYVCEGVEVSEGGIMVASTQEIPDGKRMILTFFVPGATECILRGESRYSTPPKSDGRRGVGIQFSNVKREQRRMIRDYISAKTQTEAAQDMETSQHLAKKNANR